MGGLTLSAPTGIPTSDGGARQGPADLWCTYAAVRTLSWLGVRPAGSAATANVLASHQNSDGGFAWQRGLPSDAWATYYCTQALRDLGRPLTLQRELATWLDRTRHTAGGYAMTPGQSPDVWATYYNTRTLHEFLARPVERPDPLRDWLAALQRDDGGLSWSPLSTESDVRACYYGIVAWRSAFGNAPSPWRVPRLTAWIQSCQHAAGGLAFRPSGDEACLWATFRGVRALASLGTPLGGADAEACARWIAGRHHEGGGYSRWDDDRPADVWACFCAVGSLQTLERPIPACADVVSFLESCALPDGGYTYRRPDAAGDSLATAATLLVGGSEDPETSDRAARWLHEAHLPYEDGVMYMPGRGAEVRCTLWSVSALSYSGRAPMEHGRLSAWIGRLQNADGGWGYWEGRASDMSSTVSALEILAQLQYPLSHVNTANVGGFLHSCQKQTGYGPLPGAAATCVATAQAARVWHLLGDDQAAGWAAEALDSYESSLGGYAGHERAVPDLVSTYQGVLTRQRLGLPVDGVALRRFLDKVRVHRHVYAWSPLSRTSGGPLASALGSLLDHAPRLVPLNL